MPIAAFWRVMTAGLQQEDLMLVLSGLAVVFGLVTLYLAATHSPQPRPVPVRRRPF